MRLGQVGVWTSYRAIGEQNAGEAAQLVERLGFGAFWLGGSPKLPTVRPLLQATREIVVATGIVNVWQNEPSEVASAYTELCGEFTPDRLLVGVGIGHPEVRGDYSRPLASMRAFLDGLDGSDPPVPQDHRCLAALGPRMLDLSAERSLGAHSYFVPIQHTLSARQRLGPGRLLAPELACVVDTDTERARAKARQYAKLYLGLRNYTGNLRNFGFTDQDIGDGGSDKLIDAIVPHGTADQIAAVVREHLSAGADHVCLQPVGTRGIPVAEWTALAEALELGHRAA
ncbi:MAG TPA: LLM class F420-dependent oxidoreductase [Solirubrobacteraceae bacterium]|jgi:probable F420-dependent oxidoreductase